jgi:hypothetical protein
MKVQEFPLAWRWTDSRYAVFPDAVLSQLQPLGSREAQAAFERARDFQRGSGVRGSADVSDDDGRAWLQTRHGSVRDIVTVSWSPECALRMSWQIFTEHWSDFCYPMSDDVAVWPDSERWVLFYHHEEQFEFVQRLSA